MVDQRKLASLEKFGLGLKTASISIARKLSVHKKSKKDELTSFLGS